MTFLIKHHLCTSVIICVLSNVQYKRKPADIKGSTESTSAIAIWKQTKVCCL